MVYYKMLMTGGWSKKGVFKGFSKLHPPPFITALNYQVFYFKKI